MKFLKKLLRIRKKSDRKHIDAMNSAFAKRMALAEAERISNYLTWSEACRNGFYCIRCRAPYTDIGIAFVCDCPPGQILSPIHYMEDLDPDIRRSLNKNFMKLI